MESNKLRKVLWPFATVKSYSSSIVKSTIVGAVAVGLNRFQSCFLNLWFAGSNLIPSSRTLQSNKWYCHWKLRFLYFNHPNVTKIVAVSKQNDIDRFPATTLWSYKVVQISLIQPITTLYSSAIWGQHRWCKAWSPIWFREICTTWTLQVFKRSHKTASPFAGFRPFF